MKISREFLIGVIVVVVIAILYFGINYLKGINLFSKQQTFFAVYDDVQGLTASNPLILNGFKIGLVRDVGLNENGDGRIVVEVIINDNKLVIPKDTKLEIFSPDFFGGKAIRLIMGDSSVAAMDSDTLTSAIKEDFTKTLQKEFEPLKQKTQDLIAGVDKVVTNLNKVFADTAAQGLPLVFESLQRSLKNVEIISADLSQILAGNKGRLNSIFGNVENITTNLKSNNEVITAAIANVKNLTDSLSKIQLTNTIRKTEKAMGDFAEIMEKINKGDGSIAMLINNDSLHTQLLSASASLDKLLDDMKAHPGRYVNFSLINRKNTEGLSKRQLQELRKEIDKAIEEKAAEDK
ncbi:MAG: MlaD family protein [Flavobacteriales bacterium]|nr:MlaD family protein [Flavobacteriales bacterium]